MAEQFYIAEYNWKNTGYARVSDASEPNYYASEWVLCPECGTRVSKGYWMRPRTVKLTGRKVPDFIDMLYDRVPFLLSQRAAEKIAASGLKGIKAMEEIEHVEFARKAKVEVPIPKCYHIEIEYSRMTIDHEKSNISYGSEYGEVPCRLCRQINRTYDFFRHLVFNPEEYEGYDIFHCYELAGTVILSQRFIDFYESSGLTNLNYKPAEIHGKRLAEYFLDGIEDDEDD